MVPRLSIEARRRIVSLVSGGFTVPSIVQRVEEECPCVLMSVPCNSTRGYIPCMDIFHAWLYSMRGHTLRVDIFHACMAIFHAWDYTRRVCCTLLGNMSTQTRNGIYWVPRV